MAVALELVKVIVMVEAPFVVMELGLKLLVAVGGAIAISVADAAAIVPALAVDIVPVLLAYVPAAIAVTGTTIEQLLDAGILPPDNATEEPPLIIVTEPPQVLEEGEAAVFCILLDGYVSVKDTPVIAEELLFIRVMVIFEAPDTGITPGLKPLLAVGAETTVSVADAAEPVPALVVLMFPVLFK